MLRPKLLDMAKKFLQSEIELRDRYPLLLTKGVELPIKADWDLKQGCLTKKGQGDYTFKGSIDRVDTNGQEEASVIDYKSSSGGLTNFQNWPKKDSLQLFVYAQAVENSLTDLGPHKVYSAFYYVGKDMSCEKGFRVKERESDLFDEFRGSQRSLASESTIHSVQEETMSKIQETVQKIDEGNFAPLPREPKDCQSCYWRRLCRAPHLI